MKLNKGVLYALTSSSTFGLIPLFTIPVIKEGILDDMSILFYRLLFATIGIGLATVVRRESFALTTKDLPKILFLGLFYALTSLTLLLSYYHIPSGISTAIHFLYPVGVTILMVLLYKERLSPKVALSALVAIAGVMLVSVKNEGGASSNETLGFVFVLLSVVCYAIYIVAVNKIGINKINSLALTFYVLLTGTILIGFFAATTNGIKMIPSTNTLINLSLLALICTVVSNLALIMAIKTIGGTVTAILGSLEPFIAVMVGVFVFGETITVLGIFGVILIIASVMMIVTNKK